MINRCALTTFDNPFDPFEQFVDWFLFDVEKGYNCCSIVGRLVSDKLTTDMSQREEEFVIEEAIDNFIKHDAANLYTKVYKKGSSADIESD